MVLRMFIVPVVSLVCLVYRTRQVAGREPSFGESIVCLIENSRKGCVSDASFFP